jgi:TRAP-type C4-dicarboxylate transport system permease small subunit
MAALSSILRRACAFGAGLCMAAVFVIVFVNASRRYLVGASVPWGEELPVYLTIYGVMFGLALAYLTDSHIRFSVLTDLMPARARARLLAAVDLATAATGAALAWSGVAFGLRRADRAAPGLSRAAGDLADATGIAALEWLGRMGPWQLAIAFGGALLTAAALVRFAERLSEMRG